MIGLDNEYKQMLKASALFYKVYPNGGMIWLKELDY
jgi:hypothetical protein